MAPIETEYYDLVCPTLFMQHWFSEPCLGVQLCVPVDADDTTLKKAYRKQAMKARSLTSFQST